jgi:lipopolysaccharide export system protein LptC
MKVITPKLVHYAESDTTHFTTPQLVLYRQSPQPWYVTSKFAKATQGTDNVNFWENVTIHHAADTNNPATLIKTTTLTVHPNDKTAETKDFITLTQPNVIVKATGMFADMNTGDIKLLSQARGEYVPSS